MVKVSCSLVEFLSVPVSDLVSAATRLKTLFSAWLLLHLV
jgi:hypothetical protein